MGSQNDELFVSQTVDIPNMGSVNGAGGFDTIPLDVMPVWPLPLKSVESEPAPEAIDNVMIGAIVVFGTSYTDRGGPASDLICP